jgi:ubiquinone/menaquinone biosynthesis C-methylase UbiE
MSADNITFWTQGMDCCDPVWEAAYNRFETIGQERAKFRKRLVAMGVDKMPKNLRVADLFCGRGSNLFVLSEMGFKNLSGVDLSPNLLREFTGDAKLCVGDCRDLKFPESSLDLVIVQGGLHHLPKLPEDLDKCLSEIRRVLAPDGVLMLVEPWRTPFLQLAHFCMKVGLFCKIYPRLDALAVMTEHEFGTYSAWLDHPEQIRAVAGKYFEPVADRRSLGKWYFLGKVKLAM